MYEEVDPGRAIGGTYGQRPGYFGFHPLASWPHRVAAGLIDYGPPLLVYYLLAGTEIASFIAILAAGFILFNSGYLAGVTGRSIGKRLTRLYVGRFWPPGNPPGALRGIMRALLSTALPFLWAGFAGPSQTLVYFSLLFILGNLLPLWRKHKQTLADEFTATIVVRQTWQGAYPPDWPDFDTDPR